MKFKYFEMHYLNWLVCEFAMVVLTQTLLICIMAITHKYLQLQEEGEVKKINLKGRFGDDLIEDLSGDRSGFKIRLDHL